MADPVLPVSCRPTAFDLLRAQLPELDAPAALVRGAVAIASHRHADVDAADVERQLDGLAAVVRSRVRGGQPQALLAHLHAHLFDELGFAGNQQDYYDPENNYLPRVLETRRGMPITLALVYVSVAQRLGLNAWGCGLPGHFMAAVDAGGAAGGGVMLVDAFDGGRIYSPDEARRKIAEHLGGDAVTIADDAFKPLPHALWLSRMLQNLLNVFHRQGDMKQLAAMIEMSMLLRPDEPLLERDLALLLARLGHQRPATQWLTHYLACNPDDPQRSDLQQLLDVLTA